MTRVVSIPTRLRKEMDLEKYYARTYVNGMGLSSGEKVVPGEGDVMSPILFIGEAPGEKEDETGRPFVGKSGNLLMKLMKSIELSREEVFITNLVKVRPPNNADPTEQEAMAAQTLMEFEIRILNPKIIVPLGRFATGLFYPAPHMNTLAGTCREKRLGPHLGPYTVVPMYHPSAGLRSPRTRSLMFEHIQLVREAMWLTTTKKK